MDVLVLSDSHGRYDNIRQAIKNEPQCKTVIFLGDGIDDIEKIKPEFTAVNFITVKGNNDFHYQEPLTEYKYLGGNTIVCTHGHIYGVNYSLLDLINHAQSVRANVVFYGHTHRADIYLDPRYDIYAVNPGAIMNGSYIVASLEKGKAEFKKRAL